MANANSTRKQKRLKLSNADADRIIRKVQRAPALIKKGEIDKAEREANQRDWVRRATWCILELSGKELIKKVRADRGAAVAFATLCNAMAIYTKNLDDIKGFVAAADVRIMVALTYREDMQAVMEEAKTQSAPEEAI